LEFLEYLRQEHTKGDKSALLKAVEYCGINRLVMPDWVVGYFIRSFGKWEKLEVKTLDEAFEVERKSFRIDTEREFMYKATDVYLAVLDCEKQGIPIGVEDAFRIVAEKFHTNPDKVAKMYKYVRHNDPIGRGLEQLRPKKIHKKDKK